MDIYARGKTARDRAKWAADVLDDIGSLRAERMVARDVLYRIADAADSRGAVGALDKIVNGMTWWATREDVQRIAREALEALGVEPPTTGGQSETAGAAAPRKEQEQ